MADVINEITQLTDKDSFILRERRKRAHTYPMHRHHDFELNFVENCRGTRRVVGDSIEETSDYELVLIGAQLEHVWEGEAIGEDMHEVTIHFSSDFFSDQLLKRTSMSSIATLLKRAERGISFPLKTIMHVYGDIEDLAKMEPGFQSVLKFLTLLHKLSESTDYRVLSSGAFSHTTMAVDSRRVQKVKEYIDKNYRDEIRLTTLSELAHMTPTAFSRFFKLRANRTISDYIIDVRLGHAARLLADSTMTVVEICYHCGFNNISNFNRVFRKRKGCTPTEFRANYHKRNVIV